LQKNKFNCKALPQNISGLLFAVSVPEIITINLTYFFAFIYYIIKEGKNQVKKFLKNFEKSIDKIKSIV
jgi:hypothetical protein